MQLYSNKASQSLHTLSFKDHFNINVPSYPFTPLPFLETVKLQYYYQSNTHFTHSSSDNVKHEPRPMHFILTYFTLLAVTAAAPLPSPYASPRQQLNAYGPNIAPSVIGSLFKFGVAAGNSLISVTPSQTAGVVVVPASPPKPITSMTVPLLKT
jgi:hypothetical protein